MAAVTPLAPDEAYYWIWSRVLQPGYLDHPPMVALWIRAGSIIPGPLGVRLLGPLSAALGSILLWRAAEYLAAGTGWRATLLFNATLLLNAGAVIMTPDTPLIFFWTLALFAMARLVATGQGRWWFLAGAAVGLGMDSKYTAALFPMAVGGWLVCTPRARHWLRRPEPYLAAILALAIFAPVIGWNAAHGWASFSKQGGRGGDWHPGRAVQFLLELVGGQIGLATPIIFVLCALGTERAARRWRDPGAALLAWLVLLPTLVFVQHAVGDRVQANWPCVIYPAACIAAAAYTRHWRAGAVSGAAISALVYAQATLGFLPLPARLDITAARLRGWHGWASDAAAMADQQHAAFLAADNYATGAELAWELPAMTGARPVIGPQRRWQLFTLPDLSAPDAVGLFLQDARNHDAPDPAMWRDVVKVGVVMRRHGNDILQQDIVYRVWLAHDAAHAKVLPKILPRP